MKVNKVDNTSKEILFIIVDVEKKRSIVDPQNTLIVIAV
jgi:hypothetical protein